MTSKSPLPFDKQLAIVAGTIHKVFLDDELHRRENGLLYYFNKAEELGRSAELLMAGSGAREVYVMLCGMAIEVLIKGTACALSNPAPMSHKLTYLAKRTPPGRNAASPMPSNARCAEDQPSSRSLVMQSGASDGKKLCCRTSRRCEQRRARRRRLQLRRLLAWFALLFGAIWIALNQVSKIEPPLKTA